jgi:hypothetical protein
MPFQFDPLSYTAVPRSDNVESINTGQSSLSALSEWMYGFLEEYSPANADGAFFS